MKQLRNIVVLCCAARLCYSWDTYKRMTELNKAVTDSLYAPNKTNEKSMIKNVLEFTGHMLHLLHHIAAKEKTAYEIYYRLYKDSNFQRPTMTFSADQYINLRPTYGWDHEGFLDFIEMLESAKCLWMHMHAIFNATYGDIYNIPEFLRDRLHVYKT